MGGFLLHLTVFMVFVFFILLQVFYGDAISNIKMDGYLTTSMVYYRWNNNSFFYFNILSSLYRMSHQERAQSIYGWKFDYFYVSATSGYTEVRNQIFRITVYIFFHISTAAVPMRHPVLFFSKYNHNCIYYALTSPPIALATETTDKAHIKHRFPIFKLTVKTGL